MRRWLPVLLSRLNAGPAFAASADGILIFRLVSARGAESAPVRRHG